MMKGVIGVYSTAPRLAPLRITAPWGHESNLVKLASGSSVVARESYFVKLVDAATDEPIMTMFIRGGETFETKVPLGSMRMRYASGRRWEGEDTLFGPETVYKRAERPFDFVRDSGGVHGHIVELISQPADRNFGFFGAERQSAFSLQTTEIDRSEF